MNKNLFQITILLSLGCTSVLGNDNWFKPGFLLSKEPKSQKALATKEEIPQEKEEIPQEEKGKISIWEDPSYQTAEARQKVYDYVEKFPMTECQSVLTQVEKLFLNLSTLEQNPLSLDPYLKFKGILRQIRILGDFVFQQEDLDYLKLRLTQQVMDHQLLSAILNSSVFKNYVTSGSDAEKGVLKSAQGFMGYYTETMEGNKVYRLYCKSSSRDPNGMVSLPSLSQFSGYELTAISIYKATSQGGSLRHQHTGYILDKQGCLVKENGVVVIKGSVFPDDLQAFAYQTSSIVEQKSFLTISDALPKEKISSDLTLSYLIRLAGGVDRIEKEKIVLLRESDFQQGDNVTPAQAAFLLPYAYELQLAEDEDIDQHQLNESIRLLEATIVDETYQKIGSITEDQVEKEAAISIEKLIDEAILQKDETLEKEVGEEAAKSYPNYGKKPKKMPTQKWNAKRQEAKQKAIDTIKKRKVTEALSAEEKTRRAKEKILENIRKIYLEKTKNVKHFSTSEAQEILAQMRQAFIKVGVLETDTIAKRGSHSGQEMLSAETGESVKLGVAKRPQKKGYQAGTVRTIINSHVNHILKLITKKPDVVSNSGF